MPRTKKDFARKREEWLKKIWEIFLQNGYENTTLALLRQELSVSKGVFYHYFASKEECADLAIALFLKRCIANMLAEDLSDLPTDQRLSRMMLSGARFFHEDAQQDEQINAPANAVFHEKLMIAATKKLAPVYAQVIAEGTAVHVFDTEYPLETAEMLLTLANFYLDAGLFQWQPETMPGKLHAFATAVERLLGAQKGSFDFISATT